MYKVQLLLIFAIFELKRWHVSKYYKNFDKCKNSDFFLNIALSDWKNGWGNTKQC